MHLPQARSALFFLLTLVSAALSFGGSVASAQPVPPPGFALEAIPTTAPFVSQIAVAPPEFGLFGGDLFVLSTSRTIFRIDRETETTTLFATLPAPSGIKIAFGQGGAFGFDLYVSESTGLNNAGRIRRINAAGTVLYFGDPAPPPGPPTYQRSGVGMAFSLGGPFGEALYSGTPLGDVSDALSTLPSTGGASTLFADFGTPLIGAPKDLEFGPGGAWGENLFVGMRVVSGGDGVENGIYEYDSSATRTAFSTISSDPDMVGEISAIDFSHGAVFGQFLFAIDAQQQILRVNHRGNATPFVTNISTATDLAFANDGGALYFVEFGTATLWRLAPIAAPTYGSGDSLRRYYEDFSSEVVVTDLEANYDDLTSFDSGWLGGDTLPLTGNALRLAPVPDGMDLAVFRFPGVHAAAAETLGVRGRLVMSGGPPAIGEDRCLQFNLNALVSIGTSYGIDASLCGIGQVIGAVTSELRIAESRTTGIPFSTTTTTSAALELLPSIAASIANDEEFLLDVQIDQSSQVAVLTIEVPSTSETQTLIHPLDLMSFLTTPASFSETEDFFGGAGLNVVLLAGLSGISLDLLDIEVYQPFTSHLTVDDTTDQVDLVAGDGSCATASATCTFRAAIQEANAVPGAGLIDFSLTPTDLIAMSLVGSNEDAAATGDWDVLDHLEVRGDKANPTRLFGAEIDRLIEVPDSLPGTVLQLRSLSLSGGSTQASFNEAGGGFYNAGRMTIEHSQLSENYARVGGAIFSDGKLWIFDSSFNENGAVPGMSGGPIRGGAIALGTDPSAAPFGNPEASIRRVFVEAAQSAGTGGVGSFYGSRVLIQNTTVSEAEFEITNSDLKLQNVTMVGGSPMMDITADQFMDLEINQSILSAFGDVCTIAETGGALTKILGGNGATDETCGFDSLGDLIGSPLPIDPLQPIAQTKGFPPNLATAPLDFVDISAAEFCPRRDQTGGPRPLDDDGDGTPLCDWGAIELPEPGMALGLAAGMLFLAAFAATGRHSDEAGPG